MVAVRLGCIGAGFIGQIAHIASCVGLPDVKLEAIADLRFSLCNAVADRYGVPRRYRSHTDMLAAQCVDAVIVCVPRPFLAPVVKDCLAAGVHVLSEKPMASSVARAQELVALAQAKRVLYGVGYMKRCDIGVEAARRELARFFASGELGPLLAASAHCFMGNSYCDPFGYLTSEEIADSDVVPDPLAPEWIQGEEASRYAFFLNSFTHITNLVRFLLDDDVTVVFVGRCGEGELIVLKTKDYLIPVSVGRSTNHGWDEGVCFTFRDGKISVSLPPALLCNVPSSVVLYRSKPHAVTTQLALPWQWSFRRQVERFVAAIRGDVAFPSTGASALKDVAIAEQVWRLKMTEHDQNGVER